MASVVELCGDYPENFVKEDIESNPNYIFIPDSQYQSKLLYNLEGSSVVVNSFTECEHYVSGGWNYEPLKNSETNIQNSLILVVASVIFFVYLKQKLKFIKK